MKAKYRHIIFDADHTLIDFQADERRAIRASIADIPPSKTRAGVSIADIPPFEATSDIPPSDEEIVHRIQAYSLLNWGELGLDQVHDPVIQRRYHELTYTHVHALIAYAGSQYAIQDAERAERIFFETLCLPANPCEGALEIVRELSTRFLVSVATNGLSLMQRGRLKEFMPYLHQLFISEEMETIKPAKEFGKTMLEALGARAEECLFVGDSLSSDIAMAGKLQMDAVWVNPDGRPLPEGCRVKGQIRTLKELFQYV